MVWDEHGDRYKGWREVCSEITRHEFGDCTEMFDNAPPCVLRLFNSEMFFQEDQLMALEMQLKDIALPVRQAWFEECLRLRRRRMRHVWMDTPVARLFTPQ